MAEYEATKRLEIALPLVMEQAKSDRLQRERVLLAVFVTLILQSAAMFGLIVAIGLKWLEFEKAFYSYALPAWFLEMAGMAYVIVRSLFASNSAGLLHSILNKEELGTIALNKRSPRGSASMANNPLDAAPENGDTKPGMQ